MNRPGYNTVSAYLVARTASAAIDYYIKHLGASERYRLEMGETIAHAELQVGNSILMLSDEMPEMGVLSPETVGGSPVSMLVFVEDVDQVFAAMLADRSTELSPVQDQFHGDRSGKLRDPFGHIWQIATHKHDLQPDEIIASFKKMMG